MCRVGTRRISAGPSGRVHGQAEDSDGGDHRREATVEPVAKKKIARQLRGQLMLQIAAGRFFRPDVPLHETEHRFTVYSNAWFVGDPPIALPVGEVIPSTEMALTSSAMISVVDRHE